MPLFCKNRNKSTFDISDLILGSLQYIYIYVYVYICVYVRVCVRACVRVCVCVMYLTSVTLHILRKTVKQRLHIYN